MLAKITAKNQLTLPKAAVEAVGVTEYVQALVSGDKDLLPLAGTRDLCAVLSVSAFCERVLGA